MDSSSYFWSLVVLAQTAITSYNGFSCLNVGNLFLTTLEAGSSRSGYQSGQVPMRALFLDCRWPPLVVSSGGRKGDCHLTYSTPKDSVSKH